MSGSYLQRLCKEHLEAFQEHGAAMPPPLELTWGSICSGGEGILFSFEAITVAFESYSVPVNFKHMFCCEIKPSVQNWLLAVPEVTQTHPCCVFHDACDMGKAKAYCHRHKKECVVPCVDILITGTSCKDFSRASNSYGSFESILALESWLQQAGCSDHSAFTQLVLCVRCCTMVAPCGLCMCACACGCVGASLCTSVCDSLSQSLEVCVCSPPAMLTDVL